MFYAFMVLAKEKKVKELSFGSGTRLISLQSVFYSTGQALHLHIDTTVEKLARSNGFTLLQVAMTPKPANGQTTTCVLALILSCQMICVTSVRLDHRLGIFLGNWTCAG